MVVRAEGMNVELDICTYAFNLGRIMVFTDKSSYLTVCRYVLKYFLFAKQKTKILCAKVAT